MFSILFCALLAGCLLSESPATAPDFTLPDAEARLPHHEDPLGIAVMRVLDGLRMPLRDLLKQPVSSIYEGVT